MWTTGEPAGGNETWPSMRKAVWDKIAQHWSSWGWPVKALVIVGVVVLVLALAVAWALANWGPAIKGLLWGDSKKDKPASVDFSQNALARPGTTQSTEKVS